MKRIHTRTGALRINPGQTGWYSVMLIASLLLLFLLPESATRAVLPPLVYIQPVLCGLWIFTAPIRSEAKTAGKSATRLGYLVGRIVIIAVSTLFSTGVLVTVSGVTESAPVVLLISLAAAGIFGGIGIAVASAATRNTWYRTMTAGACILAAAPLLGYVGLFTHEALLYLPGGGPFALLSLALARPLDWAVFRVAWISGIVYASAGLASGIVLYSLTAGKGAGAPGTDTGGRSTGRGSSTVKTY